MKKKILRTWFLRVAFFSFVVLLGASLSYGYARSPETWHIDLFTARFLHIPFLLYLLAIALLLGLIIAMVMYVIQRKQWQQLEEALRLLAGGNYSAEYFGEQLFEDANEELYFEDIKTSLLSIRTKLMELSKEVQEQSNQPKLVGGQTKEEILEAERRRLARELHDSVSQQLFAAMMMLSAINEQMDDTNELLQKQLKMVEGIINESQSEMRALLLHLRPINLEGKTLKTGIEQLLTELKTKIQIQLKWEIDDVSLATGIEDHLFRIVQELLSNTLRHSKATELEVYLNQYQDTVLLRVIDDGIGFDPKETKAGNYGLQNIKERVNGMGGTFKVISFLKKGTSIEIKIPLIKGSETI
ncbi:MAG: sensor histidine kinase [Carnobacterium sp.]|uniref:Sensor histidine kinase n=1 Tax=Carnobacterium antarcticum TaxID=2126436 RepID=A0ABW4NM83_9LACT|nr:MULTISPECIES: sensor histidine kinase [unclassified Carnobacterium]ALV20873.1 Sensor histidine kinase LiaS [Carnobacterium sp. CP1]QQP71031.1 sensor histidine kinase [Carnobacterium sp. CS13]